MRKKIWRYILCGLVLLICLIIRNQYQISARVAEERAFALETSNPTEWVFDASFERVKDSIWATFHEYKYRGFFIRGFDCGSSKFVPEESRISYFQMWWGRDPVPSYIYRKNGKGLPTAMRMEIHLDSLSGNQTRVRVTISSYCVNTGRGIVLAGHPPVPWWGYAWEYVRPSTIEPYEILYKIGKSLGCAYSMPAINYPSELTPKEIELTYYNYNLRNKFIWDPWDGEQQ